VRYENRMSCSACDRIVRIADGRNPDFIATLSESLAMDEQPAPQEGTELAPDEAA